MTGERRRRWSWWLALGAVLLVAAALRIPAVRAGYPYLAYVDEGHVMRPAMKQVATGRWEPSENHYPQLASRAITIAAHATALVADPFRSTPLLAPAQKPGFFWDVIKPAELLLVARGLTVLLSLAVVVMAGLYAWRLAGAAAGVVAATAAALVPALVVRGSIVIVDAYTTFFALAALFLASKVEEPRQWRRIVLAGACCGLAAVAKYPAGMVGLAVVLRLLLLPWSWGRRVGYAAMAGAAGLVAAVAVMPSLITKGGTILTRMLVEHAGYSVNQTGSYWQQAVRRAEWDLPFEGPEIGYVFLVLATAGIGVAVAVRRWRRDGVAWALFVALMVGFHASYAFQVFRHLLPVVALGCVAIGVFIAWIGERLRRPRLVAALTAALLVALFAVEDFDYVAARASLRDTRTQSVDWLVRHRDPAHKVLVLGEAPMHPDELLRLGPRIQVQGWEQARPAAMRAEPRFLLVPDLVQNDGRPLIPREQRPPLLAAYQIRATFGDRTGSVHGAFFLDNRLRVFLLERKTGARRARAEVPEQRPQPSPSP